MVREGESVQRLWKNWREWISRSQELSCTAHCGLLISLWESRPMHQMRALTLILELLRLLSSTVERVGENKSLPNRSRLSDWFDRGNPDEQPDPKKPTGSARNSWGLELRKQ